MTKRAPNGYRIVEWADGFYHVYRGGDCLDEVLSRDEALAIAKNDAAKQGVQRTTKLGRPRKKDYFNPVDVAILGGDPSL